MKHFVIVSAVLLPLFLIGLATGAAAIMAFGVHPDLANHSRGLQIIMLTRRLEWPLILLALAACMTLLGLVISNKRRVWWLIGLAPVLALFVHRFAPWRQERLYVLAEPTFITAGQEGTPADDEWVVGVVFEDEAYALPYRQLYRAPVVFITDYDKRMMLMWSAHANRAAAHHVTRELKARDLQVVATPANSLLVLNRRLGQFISGVTGQTIDREKPVGFAQPIETHRTTWEQWRRRHPTSKALLTAFAGSDYPAAPIVPRDAGALRDGVPAETPILMLHTTPPVALRDDSPEPIRNVVAGSQRLLVVRDGATTRVYQRHLGEDLFPTFVAPARSVRASAAFMIDRDSNSGWSSAGTAIDGVMQGAQLTPVPFEDGLYWGVMKYWYPDLTLGSDLPAQ